MVLHWAATRQVLLIVEQQYSVPERNALWTSQSINLWLECPAKIKKYDISHLEWQGWSAAQESVPRCLLLHRQVSYLQTAATWSKGNKIMGDSCTSFSHFAVHFASFGKTIYLTFYGQYPLHIQNLQRKLMFLLFASMRDTVSGGNGPGTWNN